MFVIVRHSVMVTSFHQTVHKLHFQKCKYGQGANICYFVFELQLWLNFGQYICTRGCYDSSSVGNYLLEVCSRYLSPHHFMLHGLDYMISSLFYSVSVPDDYKLPECFKTVDSLGIDFPKDVHALKLGRVETRFTSLSLTTKSLFNRVSTVLLI